MTRLRNPLLGLIVFSTVCLSGGASDPPPAKDPQSAIEPRSAPGEGQRFLERFVGDWEVAKTFHPRTGDPVRGRGECRQTMMHGGRFLRSEFVFHNDGKDEAGLGIIGYETDSGRFTSVWTDARSTRMSFRQSEEKFNGKEITLVGKSLDPQAKERRSRTVTRLEEDGRTIVHRQYSMTQDGQERLVMELVLTRKEPRPGN